MAFTDIVEILAPAEAAASALVAVEVRVKNIWTYPFYIGVTGHYNDTDIPFSPEYAVVDPGATYSFSASFTMPNNEVTLEVWSWYWADEEWIQEDYAYVNIPLAAEEEEAPVSLLPLALMAGVGILGASAAFALLVAGRR